MERNITIIGGGPAGLSAAIYSARANLKPLVFAGSPPGGQLTLTSDVENFPGYRSILGPELIEKMRQQAADFGTEFIDENVTEVSFDTSPFTITSSSHEVVSKAVIIATGAKALWLGLESEQRLRGKGVSACATCDGFFFRDKIVAIVGGGDTAMEEAQTLTRFAKKVYIIHRRDQFRASKIMIDRITENPKIEIVWNNEVIEVLGENVVTGLKLKSPYNGSETLELNGLFLAIGHKPDTGIFKDKIELDEKGYVITTERLAYDHLLNKVELSDSKKVGFSTGVHYHTSTSIPGVFAAGDNVDYIYRQAATAVGMGVAASLDAERWLAEN